MQRGQISSVSLWITQRGRRGTRDTCTFSPISKAFFKNIYIVLPQSTIFHPCRPYFPMSRPRSFQNVRLLGSATFSGERVSCSRVSRLSTTMHARQCDLIRHLTLRLQHDLQKRHSSVAVDTATAPIPFPNVRSQRLTTLKATPST